MFFANSRGGKVLVENTQGKKPRTFEIDFLNGNDAVVLKWRNATTDGDHITKEHTRVKAIQGDVLLPATGVSHKNTGSPKNDLCWN